MLNLFLLLTFILIITRFLKIPFVKFYQMTKKKKMLILEILSMINIIVEGQILSTYFGFSFVRMSSTSFKFSRGIKLY